MPRSSMAVFSALWRAYGEGRLDRALHLVDPDCEFTLPDGRAYRGHDGIRDYLPRRAPRLADRRDHLRRRPRGRPRLHRRGRPRGGVLGRTGGPASSARWHASPSSATAGSSAAGVRRPRRRDRLRRTRSPAERAAPSARRPLGPTARRPPRSARASSPRASATASSAVATSPAKRASAIASSSSPSRGPGAMPSARASSSPRTSGCGVARRAGLERDGEHLAGEREVAGDRRVGLAPPRRQPVGDRQQRHVDRDRRGVAQVAVAPCGGRAAPGARGSRGRGGGASAPATCARRRSLARSRASTSRASAAPSRRGAGKPIAPVAAARRASSAWRRRAAARRSAGRRRA